MSRKRKKLQGTVQKVIKPANPSEPEKAQIDIREAEDLYREIRIENVVTDENGEKARLKPGAEADVIVEADSSATIKKPENLGQRGHQQSLTEQFHLLWPRQSERLPRSAYPPQNSADDAPAGFHCQ